MKRIVWICAFGVFGVCKTAAASSFAALEELPVTSGELRLAQPEQQERLNGAVTFPLLSTKVDAQLSGMMAQVTVEQTFDNPFFEPIDAVYVFPMSIDAAVNRYEIQIGERTIKGQLETIEEAKRVFAAAKASGQTAAILEARKPNIFKQSLANIPPGARVRVRLSYVEGLRYERSAYEFVFPLVVAPRYLPGKGESKEGSAPPRVELAIELDAGVPIWGVDSPSHQVHINALDRTRRAVRFAGPGKSEDFILRFQTGAERTFAGFIAHREAQEGYFNLVIQPKAKYSTAEITPREIILLIDRSCSMKGAPLMQAKRVANRVIDSLGHRDTLNIIAFSDRALTLSKSPVQTVNRASAHRFVNQLRAGGGTRLLSSVTRSLLQRPKGRVRMVFVLTDGAVGNDDQILGAVRKRAGHNRIFVVGLGKAPNRYLLDRLAAEGRGFSTYIAPRERGGAQISSLIKKTKRPYLTNIEIDWGRLAIEAPLPRVIPDVYADRPLTLTGRYRKPGRDTISIMGTVAGRSVKIPLEVTLPDRAYNPGVPYLWARKRLDGLMSRDYERNRPNIKREIITLGRRFNVVTPYTAFVAVDDGTTQAGAEQISAHLSDAERPQRIGAAEPVNASRTMSAPKIARAPTGEPRGYEKLKQAKRAKRVDRADRADRPDRPERPRRRRRSFSGGGGGDVDPITLTTILSTVPLAWRLRRRRKRSARNA